MSIDIRTAIDHGLLLVREIRQEIRHESLQTRGIIARQEDRIREPAFVEIPRSPHGFRVCGRVRQRHFITTIVLQRNGRVVAENLLADMVGSSVREQDVVAAPVALLEVGDGEVGEVLRGEGVEAAEDDGLVDGEPVADAVAEGCVGDTSVVDEVGDDGGREPAAVGVLEV